MHKISWEKDELKIHLLKKKLQKRNVYDEIIYVV